MPRLCQRCIGTGLERVLNHPKPVWREIVSQWSLRDRKSLPPKLYRLFIEVLLLQF